MGHGQRLESKWITVLFVLVPAASGLRANIVDVSDGVELLEPAPADVRLGVLQSITHYFAFDERQNVLLGENLAIDSTTGDVVTPGVLDEGTVVSSHLIHTNPFEGTNNCGPDDRICFPRVVIRFDSEILGFYFRNPPVSLVETDGILGLPETQYETEFVARGAGNFPQFESISIQNGNELVLTLNAAAGAMDNVRVITRGVKLPEMPFRRGDCNDDGAVDIADAVCILNWLFVGEATPGCVAATNTNGDDAADITDATYLLNHLFSGGAAPAQPFPDCGPGMLPADVELGCTNPPNCQ